MEGTKQMKRKDQQISYARKLYLAKNKSNRFWIIFFRIAILVGFLGIWELFAETGVYDPFITSSPSRIVITTKRLFAENDLLYHVGITLSETLLGFFIAVSGGYLIALILWWSDRLQKILEPYIVVLNSLPKIALGPVIIVWFGSGMKAIVFMAMLIGIIVTIITMLNGFISADKAKILLLKSMGANKLQILFKLIIPSSMPSFISMLKINVGMAWIGSIMGEYLVSRAGLGYLIVYGGQVFKLDLVMAATIILCILAAAMYAIVAFLEKILIKSGNYH